MANKFPFSNVLIHAQWIGSRPISNKTLTDRNGSFDLILDSDALELIKVEHERTNSERIAIQFNYKEFEYNRYVDFDSISFPILIQLDTLPANSTLKIEHQPLRSPYSLATFDLLIYNSGNSKAEISSMQFELKTTEEDCESTLQSGVQNVSDVLILSIDDETSEVVSEEPIINKIDFRPRNLGLCGTVWAFQAFTINANDVERIRIDIQSEVIRNEFNDYSKGKGPYGSYSSQTGHVYEDTPRLKKEDLRYYIVEAEVNFSPVADKYPWGQTSARSEMEPGRFKTRDLATLNSH